MESYTLTYSTITDGWPSFYSYEPEAIVNLNQYMYTFKGGNLYRHNVNPVRNEYYGTQFSSKMTSVFNEMPTANKLYKAMGLHSTDSWDMTMETDISSTGEISSVFFEKKEGVWFSFIRNSSDVPSNLSDYQLRIAVGIANSTSVNTAVPTDTIINFDSGQFTYVSVGSIISVGDYMYFNSLGTPVLCGVVTNVEVDIPNGINRVRINTTIPSTTPIPSNVEFFLFVKSGNIENASILGHYMVFTMENSSTSKVELFSVETDVMNSYP
jgi:hypothetical protein